MQAHVLQMKWYNVWDLLQNNWDEGWLGEWIKQDQP